MHESNVVDRPSSVLTAQLVQSVAAQSVGTFGALLFAAQRQVLPDLLGAYERLNRHIGRAVSNEPPMRDVLTFSLARAEEFGLIAAVVSVFGKAIRNADALDRETHWREADAVVKGWVVKEIAAEEGRMLFCQAEADQAVDNEEDLDAESWLASVDRHRTQAAWYRDWLARHDGQGV
jgi:uncharacterized membrane protein YdfJ with MMPL/SSD domain